MSFFLAFIVFGMAIPSVYVIAGLVTARYAYRYVRPYREPVSCSISHRHHTASCYRRLGWFDTRDEAVACAIIAGIFWPLAIVIGPATIGAVAVTRSLSRMSCSYVLSEPSDRRQEIEYREAASQKDG